ncbi:superoxide dismutase [Streptomyces sp. NPDC051907]|uniref:SMP-30/gluconolactonase/LRE family protein n=1 Tax=Streptomyces sp. NPDC051907 TaxID=3155284 RepID=UPI00343CC2CF
MPRALRSSLLALPLALCLALPLASSSQATEGTGSTDATTSPRPAKIRTAYALPGDRAYPEGIATDPRNGDVYVGSYTTGAVYRAASGDRTAKVFLPAGTDGRSTANGLKADRAGRLWVTDSTAGVSVYDIRKRRLLARFDVPGEGARFVNDIVIAPDGTAYLTDSVRAVIYRVTPAQLSRTMAGSGRATLATRYDLTPAIGPDRSQYTLNGIVADPTGRYLLTPDMSAGTLYRVDLASGTTRRVTLKGGTMLSADGLELRHGTLWAAHNFRNKLTRWHVSPDGTRAWQTAELSDPTLQAPTTLLHRAGRLLVVRSQFDKGGPLGPGVPQTPFSVASVDGI